MNINNTNTITTIPKQHFEILDGLRGVAAISVVIFHFMEIIISDFSKNFIAHGFLAVDFFFCLSGFVIAYAYTDRMATMKLSTFFKLRLIRLHPLVILGSILGLLTFLFDPFSNVASLYSLAKTSGIFLCSILMIPCPVMPERYFNLFSFNAPAWSLFGEYIANIIFALGLYKIGRNLLFVLTFIAALFIIYINYRAGNLLGGWAGVNFFDGLVRLSYSFLAGLLIFHANLAIKSKLGFIELSILLVLAFLMPFGKWNLWTESFVVIFYFPFLVALGAGAKLSEGFKKICQFSGNISYPLYMTHYCALWIFANYWIKTKPDANQITIIVIISVPLLVGMAYLASKFYDTPLRKYLQSRK